MTTPRGRAPLGRTSAPRLPGSARARLARFEDATTHPSFLTVPAAYGVRAAGFEAVGDVMGCIAFQTGVEYLGRCGTTSSRAQSRVVFPSSTGSSAMSYVRQLANAYRSTLERLRAEAVALGADGVLGISLQLEQHESLREIVAIGTAVRSLGRVRPKRVFTTDLSGHDVAKLMAGGWTPVDLHVVVQLGIRHDDLLTMREAGGPRMKSNREVSGYSELRQQLSGRVRAQFRGRVVKSGADGALLAGLGVHTWHRHCMSVANCSDHIGLATASGTSIARFAVPSTSMPAPLTVLAVGKGSR